MAAAFPLEPPNQDSASASKSDKLLDRIQILARVRIHVKNVPKWRELNRF
jgi:hypothetical protein